MPPISSRVPTGLARRYSRSRTLRIVSATVTARSFRPVAPSGLAAAALAATFTLSLAGTSLGAAGNQPRAQDDAQGQPLSSPVLSPGAGYGVQGGSRPVRQLQRRLRGDGYLAGPVDGLYGPRTATAVRLFQRANGLVPDGVVGPKTLSAASPRGHPVRPGAGYGSAGGDLRVRHVQGMLRTVGYDPGPADGRFGPRTQAAVQWFQAKHGLRPSGVVDSASLIRLRELSQDRPLPSPSTPQLEAPPLPSAGWHGRPIRNPQPGRSAQVSRWARTHGPVHPLGLGAGSRTQDGSQRVRRIQRTLHQLGYESGPVDGRFGPRTRASVQWLQMKYGLDPSGTIDVATLGYLRALPKGEAPAQAAPKQVKASPSHPQGKPAEPRGELANAQAVALGNNAVPLLVLALLGGLGAAAVWPRRRQRLGGP
jgi:peptidoglycan hydrolase-like protein with peptidoglycan-binding domain